MKLLDITAINAGYPFRGKIAAATSTAVKGPSSTPSSASMVMAVQMKDISPTQQILWHTCTTTQLLGKRQPNWLQPGDILLAARGSHHYAVAVDQQLLQLGCQAVAAPHFFVLNVAYSGVLPGYLAWWLNQSPCQGYFAQHAEGSLAKSIRRRVVENTPVVVPSVPQQRAIMRLVDTLQEQHQLIKQLLNNGEQIFASIAHGLLLQQDY